MGRRFGFGALIVCGLLLFPQPASSYSVLSHEALVDSLWDDVIVGLLRQKFPRATADQITAARAFAYGGAVVQDLGYYPFGSRFFTNLLHYVRSGDFLEAMIRQSRTVNEYAFALGSLAHYASDTEGHPIAINRTVPLMYPKVRAKYGDEVTFAQDPKRHIMVEFAFDVAQLANGKYQADSYHRFIGFEVSKPLLERAFQDTYGITMKSLFVDEDLAIGTYRFAVSKLIPDLTRAAARDKKDAFVFTYTPADFEKDFGTKYRRPRFFARFIFFIAKIVPKIGPLRPLAFDPPTPEAERLFLESFTRARTLYRTQLQDLRANRLSLKNINFDTGLPTTKGEYPLADKTYFELAKKLIKRPASDVSPAIRAEVNHFFGSAVLASH